MSNGDDRRSDKLQAIEFRQYAYNRAQQRWQPLEVNGAGNLNTTVDPSSIVHNFLSGLTTGDPHTQYALLAGATFTGAVVFNSTVTMDAGGGAGTNSSSIILVDGDATSTTITQQASSDACVFLNNTGAFHYQAGNDSANYVIITVDSGKPTINTAGANNLQILSNSGTISFGDENVTTTGTVTGINVTSGADPGHSHTAVAAHTHDGDTLQLDGVNSNGGAFAFTTTGAVTFNQSVTAAGLVLTANADVGAYSIRASHFTADAGTSTFGDGASTDYLSISATGVLTYAGAARPKRSMSVGAASMWPSTTSGCAAVSKREYATNDQDVWELAFDASSDEYAQFTVWMPDAWDGGTITAIFYWSVAVGAGGTVEWAIQGRAYANDDAIDQAWGTAQSVNDTALAMGDMAKTAATSAVTLAGSPAGGQMVQFRVYRDVSEDSLAADALLLGIKIEYTVTAESD